MVREPFLASRSFLLSTIPMRHQPSTHLLCAALLTPLAAGQISFQIPTTLPAPLEPDGITCADLDGDGDVDLAVVTEAPDKVSLYFNQGSASFLSPINVFVGGGTSPSDVAAADIDLDGDMDLLVTLKDSNTVRTLINGGTGNFVAGGSTATGGLEPRAIAVTDLNGDGQIDAVTSNRDSNTVSVLINNGGSFTASVFAAGAEPRFLGLGDITGDGVADIVVAAHDDRTVNVLAGTGTGAFGPPSSTFVGGNLRPEGIAIADLDNDGDADVLASTSGNGLNFVSAFLNVGGQLSAPIHSAAGGVEPGEIVAADFDGDGQIDAAMANKTSNSVSVLPGLGGGVFGAALVLAGGIEPEGLTAADLDGNGSTDLVSSNKLSSDVRVFVNDNGGTTGQIGTSYCQALANSSGQAASIAATGSEMVAANDLTLSAAGLPVGQFGYFLMSTSQAFQPGFGGSQGILCLGSPIVRFNQNVLTSSPMGTVSFPVDLTALPGGTVISSGQAWNFQYWTRDANPAPTSNTSDAVTILFQ